MTPGLDACRPEALREQRGIARYVEEVVGADELGDVGLWDREDGEGYRKALASAISKSY